MKTYLKCLVPQALAHSLPQESHGTAEVVKNCMKNKPEMDKKREIIEVVFFLFK